MKDTRVEAISEQTIKDMSADSYNLDIKAKGLYDSRIKRQKVI